MQSEPRPGSQQKDGPVGDPETGSDLLSPTKLSSCVIFPFLYSGIICHFFLNIMAGLCWVCDIKEKVLSHTWAREAKRRAVPT